MSFRGVLKIFILASLTIVFTLSPASGENYQPYCNSIKIDKSILKSGDVIFRRGLSFISNIVLLADKRSTFSHVGLIYLKGDEVFVIHTTPDESDDGIDRVKLDPLDQFLRTDRATETTVYRLQDSIQIFFADKSIANALNYFKQKILFDASLDLTDSNELYCTELVWKAYRDSGIDLINSKFDKLNIPLGNGTYILPGSLLNSRYLKQIVINTQYKEEK